MRSSISSALAAMAATAVTLPAVAQEAYQTPPPNLAALVDAPQTPDWEVSPDRATVLIMHRPGLSPIEALAAPELRLAGLRMNPANNGPSRSPGYSALSFVSLAGEERAVDGLPEIGIRNVTWSPEGTHVAFTVDREDRIDLYVADATTATARQVTEHAVNDAGPGRPYEWVGNASLVVLTVPPGRGAAPTRSTGPTGPVIQENDGEQAPARTYQDLLQDPQDEALFTFMLTSQPVLVGLDGSEEPLGEPGLFANVAPSPDRRYLLVESVHEPFSYSVPYYRFPTTIEVWDASGTSLATVAELPLAEDVPTAFGSVRTGARDVEWRPDVGATLTWAEALDGGDADADAELRDRIVMLEAPFDAEPREIARLPLRFAGASWTPDGIALVEESWWTTRRRRTYLVDVAAGGEPTVLFDLSTEDRYGDPGSPVTRGTPAGTRVVQTVNGGGGVLMVGEGASPEGARPFLRRLDLSSGETDELFRSETPYYERPVDVLDGEGQVILTRRESPSEAPNLFVRDLDAGSVTRLTDFPHPHPALAEIQKEALLYERADGVALSATLYLPPGYDATRDGPLPTLVWAYPREFKSADAAGQRSDSPHRFTRVSYWGAVPYVVQGYAVIDDAAMPVVGQGDAEPNDTFREQLVANARAAIDEGVRRGVVDPDRVAIGGHSYGAFMTANLLAHSDLFRAGIARSGAYNRTLTPFGFQREERLFWEAPEIYFYMSPFMHAEKVDEPILLIHGMADNNSGTFPIQSERFFAAIKGLGGTARLVMLPHESHGYRSRESILHMLWETNRWLDMHVKNAEPRPRQVTDRPVS